MLYCTERCTTQIENWSAELPYSFLFSSMKGKCISCSLAFPKTQYSNLTTTGFSGALAMCYMTTSLQWKFHRNYYIDSILSENHPTFKWYIQGVCSTGKHVTYLKMSCAVRKSKARTSFAGLSVRYTRFCWVLRSYLIASKKRFMPTRESREIHSISHGPESPIV